MGDMFAFEWVALGFFALMLAVALYRGQGRAAIPAAALLVIVFGAGTLAPLGARAWLAHAYLAFGYWIPAWMTTAAEPSPRFETWLATMERRWRPVTAAMPRLAMALGDLAYVLCYPLVPFAFVAVSVSGGADDVDRFWTSVLIAAFFCYGTLPWLVSRPPRLRQGAPVVTAPLARVNAWVLSRISHERNTFPSGHVAVSTAAALTVWPVWPAAGIVCGIVAVGVAVGAVTGRYHYVADVGIGLVVGILASVFP